MIQYNWSMLTFALTASSKLEIIQRDLDSFASISCSHIFKPCTTKRVDISFESHSSIHHAPHNELTSRQLYLCHLEEHHRRYMFIPQTTQPIVSFKGVLLCFFTFICLLLYVCLGIKSQSPLQREIFSFKNIPFQELQRTARLDYKVVFLYLWHHKF